MPESDDYERTWVQRPPAAPTPSASAAATAAEEARDEARSNALPAGTRIFEFEVMGLIGIGGFGIVYLAHDHSLGRSVALKEYMPSSLAARIQGLTVAVKSARQAETFAIGLRSFVNEARLLAQFDHPSLVKVYRFWEANGTAWMAMPFYEGVTLKQVLQSMPGPPNEAWLRGVIEPLLDALEVIHREHCFHRDIAPDNILLLKDGRPLLLDFGAARRVIGDRTQALTVILKPGYAPLEQYAEVPHIKQGAWTDIYALAAVVYNAITGRPPMPSVGRSINDAMVPLTRAAAGRYTPGFLYAIDRALAVKPEDRPQTIAEFRALLAAKDAPVLPQTSGRDKPTKPATEQPEAKDQPVTKEAPAKTGANRTALLAGAVGGVLLIAGGAIYLLKSGPEPSSPAVAPVPSTAPTAPGSPQASASPAPSVGEVQTTEDGRVSEKELVDILLRKGGATNAPSTIPRPFDPADMLQEIYDQRDVSHLVTVVADKARVKIGRDKLRFRVSSAKPGYLYLLMVGSDGKHFNLLFPNMIDADNGIAGDGELSLPRPGWAMTAGGPPGTNRFVVIVSENRRDFSAAGLTKVDPFYEFPLTVATKVAQQSPTGAANPFAGRVICPTGRTCSSRYGAAIFSIDEVK